MKKIIIEIVIEKDKIATAIKDIGFEKDSMSSQLEILGIMENSKVIIQERIKELLNKKI